MTTVTDADRAGHGALRRPRLSCFFHLVPHLLHCPPRQASPLQCRVVTSCDYDDLDKVPTVDLAPSAPDASDDAASAASTTLASDMAALLPSGWLGVPLFSHMAVAVSGQSPAPDYRAAEVQNASFSRPHLLTTLRT